MFVEEMFLQMSYLFPKRWFLRSSDDLSWMMNTTGLFLTKKYNFPSWISKPANPSEDDFNVPSWSPLTISVNGSTNTECMTHCLCLCRLRSRSIFLLCYIAHFWMFFGFLRCLPLRSRLPCYFDIITYATTVSMCLRVTKHYCQLRWFILNVRKHQHCMSKCQFTFPGICIVTLSVVSFTVFAFYIIYQVPGFIATWHTHTPIIFSWQLTSRQFTYFNVCIHKSPL